MAKRFAMITAPRHPVRWGIENPKDWVILMNQPDTDDIIIKSVGEIAGAVQGINTPERQARLKDMAMPCGHLFFCDNWNIWGQIAETGKDDRLSGQVCRRYR